jgi:hypothetical protein
LPPLEPEKGVALVADFVRLEFDKTRKLKARHRHIRDAVRESGRPITELVNDPFGGIPYVLRALLQGGAGDTVTLDAASDLIDVWMERHGDIVPLQKAIVGVLSGYLRIEQTPSEEEPEGEAPTPVAPGPVDA